MRWFSVLGGACCFLFTLVPSHGQENGQRKNTYFHNISVDAEGHVCYLENIAGSEFNRIEYRTNGKSTLDIFFQDDEARVTVQLSDYDNNGVVDHVYVMREDLSKKKNNVRTVDYYRGPEYLEHLKRHYKHALLTATHPLIAHRPDEQERARKIKKNLEAMDNINIKTNELGVYTADGMFVESKSGDVKESFLACDTLNSAVRNVLSGDFRVLSQTPEITKKYNVEINALAGIKPPPRRFEE